MVKQILTLNERLKRGVNATANVIRYGACKTLRICRLGIANDDTHGVEIPAETFFSDLVILSRLTCSLNDFFISTQ